MMRFRSLVHVVSQAVLFPLCLTVPLFAQGFGTITGTIVDPSGAALAQGKVVATEVATGLSRSSVAGQDGYYVLNSLRPAEYILTRMCVLGCAASQVPLFFIITTCMQF